MDKNKLDKTKENIGISKLDEKTRKKLFNKFVEAGGEVQNNKKRKNLSIDRKKQSEFLKKYNDSESRALRQVSPKNNSQTGKDKRLTRSSENAFIRFIDRMNIKFHLKFLGVANFSGEFLPVFFRKFDEVYRPGFIDIQSIYFNIFKGSRDYGDKIIDKLDEISSIYYELIEMIIKVYDNVQFDEISNGEPESGYPLKRINELKTPLTEIFRKLYVLRTYDNMLLSAFDKAIALFVRHNSETDLTVQSVKKQSRKILYSIFYKLYPQLHWLFCSYQERSFRMDDPMIERLLTIDALEKPGNRTLRRKDNLDIQRNEPQEMVSDESKEKPSHIKVGLDMMYRLNFNELRKKYDREGLFRFVSENDKVFVTYLLFNEFDKEYSFIFTTNRIKYFVNFNDHGRIDYRIRLSKLYDEMRRSLEGMKEYADVLDQYEKIRTQKPISNMQYIQYTKRLEDIQKKRSSVAKNARGLVREYLEKVSDEFGVLVDDMNSDQRFITNPQDMLTFEDIADYHPKIADRKIYDAVNMVYCYSSALAWRLGPDGDLGGSIDDENEIIQGKAEPAQDPAIDEKKEPAAQEKKSLLDELDDMI